MLVCELINIFHGDGDGRGAVLQDERGFLARPKQIISEGLKRASAGGPVPQEFLRVSGALAEDEFGVAPETRRGQSQNGGFFRRYCWEARDGEADLSTAS